MWFLRIYTPAFHSFNVSRILTDTTAQNFEKQNVGFELSAIRGLFRGNKGKVCHISACLVLSNGTVSELRY